MRASLLSARLFMIFGVCVILYTTHRSLVALRSGHLQQSEIDQDKSSGHSLFGSWIPSLLIDVNEGSEPDRCHFAKHSYGEGTTNLATPSVLPSPNQIVWENLRAALYECEPQNPPITVSAKVDSVSVASENPDKPPDNVQMTDEDIELMKGAHAKFVEIIQSDTIPLNYEPGTKGVVTTVSEVDLGSVAVSLRMLRRTGCELPVEVFVSADSVATSPICADVLTKLNVKCISTEPIIACDQDVFQNNRYLNKMLAVLMSSFDDNLLIDADNLPIVDPSSFFDSEPYTSRGLIAWPDFWYSSISAKHAIVTSTELPVVSGSVESGQLLVSKQRHANTLLLALYYNFYGPDYYYVLESQGAAGEGDKETFLNAALALSAPYYLVSKRVEAIGHGIGGKFHGLGMVQFDPIHDLLNQLNGNGPDDAGYVKPRVAFIHHNMIKLIPDTIFTHHLQYEVLQPGNYARLWGDKTSTLERYGGIDMERIMWETIKDVACDLDERGLVQEAYEKKGALCQNYKDYMDAAIG